MPDDPAFDVQWSLLNTGQTVNGSVGAAGADIDAPDEAQARAELQVRLEDAVGDRDL